MRALFRPAPQERDLSAHDNHEAPRHGAREHGVPEGLGPGLGAERLGLLALRWPVWCALIAVVFSVIAALGVARINVDDSLSQLFRSNTPEFRQYEDMSRRFPSSEFDVLIVVEGPQLLRREGLSELREFVTEVQLVDGVKGVISLFSARQAPKGDEIPPPLFPPDLPQGEAFNTLAEGARGNEIIRGKLLSEDGKLALVVASLDRDMVASVGLREVVANIRETAASTLEGSGLTAQLSGAPVMQLEIRNAVERDRIIYNAVGFLLGCLVASIFFRKLSFIIVAAAPPLIAIPWSLGMLGWMDFRLNMFLNVMTPLIMVMGFSDTMQITYAAREKLLEGATRKEALRSAILVVGPACVVTVATTALSFLTLALSDSDLIRTFGLAGAISTLTSYVCVIVLCPMLGMFFMSGAGVTQVRLKQADSAVNMLRRFCGFLARAMTARPLLWTAASVCVVAGLCVVYATLEPRYRLADQAPDREQAVKAAARLDAQLSGANPVHVLIDLPKGQNLFDPATLDVIDAVHRAVETEAGVGNVWSLETLRAWLAEKAGKSDIAVLQKYVSMLPEHLTRRFIAKEQDAVVVTGRIPDIDASRLLPVIDRLENALAPIRAAHPGYRISVTGLAAIAARNSAGMIGQLNGSLTIEMIFVAAFIGLAFRSLAVVALTILPGLFPIVASGAVLWALGEGLQFASIVALTVAFGLGLDATIHYLNRLRLEEAPGEAPRDSIVRATVLVGPALILTSLVLAFGLGVTVLSDLPSLRLFGWLSAVTILAALAGDLLILPASVMLLRRFARKR
ncbi:MAG: MMPL family transporter [Beijerinckiaceae bacterium]|nr:MMPL family transporter [Beijerinckiaceae bacterium]